MHHVGVSMMLLRSPRHRCAAAVALLKCLASRSTVSMPLLVRGVDDAVMVMLLVLQAMEMQWTLLLQSAT
jgi:hypothetical protein